MRHKSVRRFLFAVALLISAVPVVASAQVNRERSYDRYDYRDRYDRVNRREAREIIARLENSSIRLENDLNSTPGRRVLGIFQLRNVYNNAIAQVRDFRRAVRRVRNNSGNNVDEAQAVLDQGIQLDRYLRLRTGSTRVDADLSELRSNLHILADAYGLTIAY